LRSAGLVVVYLGAAAIYTSQYDVDKASQHEVILRHVTRGNPSFLNGVPELLVLSLLEQREMYGYELVQSIRARSEDAFRFGEGCIYPYLHYLEDAKLVSSRRAEAAGRSRLYYRLTSKGKKRLAGLTEEWRRVAKGVEMILGTAHA